MTTQQFVILSKVPADGGELPAIGSRPEILEMLSRLNTGPEREGEDILYGPGICLQLPPGCDPIAQMLMSITEEEIAWHVITRLVKKLNCKLLDAGTGREFNA